MEDNTLDNTDIQEPLKSSQELRNEQWKAIQDANVECDMAIQNMEYQGINVKMDSEFKTNLMGLLIVELNGESKYPIMMNLNGTDIKTFNNATELKLFSKAVSSHTSMQYARCWVKKTQINAKYIPLIAEAERREAESREAEL